jgi:two-component system cell cycle sensor histidine kinase/response regulator CckA
VLFNAAVVHLGDQRYSLNSFLDLTSQKAAERERLRLESALRQSQKMESLGTLAGGIAHDFNNILTGIFGALEFIRDTVGPGERDLVALATSSAERAKALVQQILTFSRRHESERKPVRLTPIVEEGVASAARPRSRQWSSCGPSLSRVVVSCSPMPRRCIRW